MSLEIMTKYLKCQTKSHFLCVFNNDSFSILTVKMKCFLTQFLVKPSVNIFFRRKEKQVEAQSYFSWYTKLWPIRTTFVFKQSADVCHVLLVRRLIWSFFGFNFHSIFLSTLYTKNQLKRIQMVKARCTLKNKYQKYSLQPRQAVPSLFPWHTLISLFYYLLQHANEIIMS